MRPVALALERVSGLGGRAGVRCDVSKRGRYGVVHQWCELPSERGHDGEDLDSKRVTRGRRGTRQRDAELHALGSQKATDDGSAGRACGSVRACPACVGPRSEGGAMPELRTIPGRRCGRSGQGERRRACGPRRRRRRRGENEREASDCRSFFRKVRAIFLQKLPYALSSFPISSICLWNVAAISGLFIRSFICCSAFFMACLN